MTQVSAEKADAVIVGAGAPTWGAAHKRYQRENFRHYLRLFAPAEDMPQYKNRVGVSPTVRDKWGIPAGFITKEWKGGARQAGRKEV